MIDTYYRIKALHNLGIQIHLHSFEYGRPHSKELESLCKSVSYYPRKSGVLQHFSLLPFIVRTRRSDGLLESLAKNDYPILFDGLHTTYYINHPLLLNRKKLVRLHNIEHRYYRSLANYETNMIRKFYFMGESLKLKWYEKVLGNTDCILPLSIIEQEYFKKRYSNSVYLAAFHPFNKSESLPGFGDYILYHGDLSVNENAAMAVSLISDVFSRVTHPCIIAGKNAPDHLISDASRYSNIRIVSNPDNTEMKRLILNAHINLLPALSSHGFKLKLLFALYAGRHCLINSVIGDSTSAGGLCHIADSKKEIAEKIGTLMQERFTEEMILERTKILYEQYSNLTNGKKLINIVFPA
jgi:hypothetical protein